MLPQHTWIENVVLSRLPASLEHLIIKCGRGEGPPKDAISSFVYQCGPFLTRFASSEPLPEAAFNRLMQLPNLRSWVAVHKPPRTLPLVTFPSFQEPRLNGAARAWLHLLAPHGDGQLQDGLVPLPPTILNTNIKDLRLSRVRPYRFDSITFCIDALEFGHAAHEERPLRHGGILYLLPNGG